MTRPAAVAFMPTPFSELEVIGSPGLMAPPSMFTLTGTRPARAMG